MPYKPFIQLIITPQSAFERSLAEWDVAIRLARRALLLPRVAELIIPLPDFESLPQSVKFHLIAAHRSGAARNRAMVWEVECIAKALANLDAPVVLLKGAAYRYAQLPAARGRVFADVDILVPKEKLDEAEQLLMRSGWLNTHVKRYDQRYYRQWMHELPPMRHAVRKSVIDVHHAILPETARLRPDSKELLASAVTVGDGLFLVLSPEDMVLHSATHLFHDGELEHGLRDLVDLDSLLRGFSTLDGFWPRLLERSKILGLQRPLYYAAEYVQQILETPIPPAISKEIAISGKPNRVLCWLMKQLFEHALAPDHPICNRPFTGLARWSLYVRSHYLRMPLSLLVPHLVRKALVSKSEG